MPRSPRLLLPQSYYHIMTRGNNRNSVFRDDEDYHYFLQLLAKYKADHPFNLYHYCLMPNHTHLQISARKATDFTIFMKRLNLAYFHHFRKKYGWIGHFWQDRYKSQPIGKDAYFIQCGQYIELNPVRARLVEKPEHYHHSSYRYYAFSEPNDLITTDLFYETLGQTIQKRQQAYQLLVIEKPVIANYKERVWGSRPQRHNERQKIRYHLG